jgi:hypothetical protein
MGRGISYPVDKDHLTSEDIGLFPGQVQDLNMFSMASGILFYARLPDLSTLTNACSEARAPSTKKAAALSPCM